MSLIKHWDDIDFVAVATVHKVRVDYLVYEILGREESGAYVYHQKGESSRPSPVSTLADAEIFLNGSVKGDGCSDWEFVDTFHSCDRKHLIAVGEVMARCWDWTRDLLEVWNGD